MSYSKVKQITDEANATLVAVSKTKPNSAILDLYNSGHRHFGENRVQELIEKYESLPKDIKWHQIGSLQSNKVKYIAPFIHLIHSVDSMKLVNVIIKEAEKNERCIDILIQIKVASEDTKQGVDIDSLSSFINQIIEKKSDHIAVKGLMAMATFTDDTEQVKEEFLRAKALFRDIRSKYGAYLNEFNILSMGMSGDYQLALECGSNMVRVGSLIFGER